MAPAFVVVKESGEREAYEWSIVGVFEDEPSAHAVAWKHAFDGDLRDSLSVHAWSKGGTHCLGVSHLRASELGRDWGGAEIARMAAAVDLGDVPAALAAYCTTVRTTRSM